MATLSVRPPPPPGAYHVPHAKLTLPDGSSYEGELVGAEMYGSGHRTYLDGSSYTGELAYGERCGRGTLKSPDGSSYEGEWVANMYEGQGKLTRADGSTHEGEFVKHKPNGKGKATAANGDEWQGVFVNGAMFGEHGEYKGVDGSMYVGEWKVGHRDGRGNGFDASSGVRYDGVWVADEPEHASRALFAYGGWTEVKEQETVSVPSEEEGGEPTDETREITRRVRVPLVEPVVVHAGETLEAMYVSLVRHNDPPTEEETQKREEAAEAGEPLPPRPAVIPLPEETGRRMAVSLYPAAQFDAAETFAFEETSSAGDKNKNAKKGDAPAEPQAPPALSVTDEQLAELEAVALNGPEVLPEDMPPWGDDEKAALASAEEAHNAKRAELEALLRVEGPRDAEAIAAATQELVELAAALDAAQPPAWVSDPPPPYTAETIRYDRAADDPETSTLAGISIDATVAPGDYTAVITTELSLSEMSRLSAWRADHPDDDQGAGVEEGGEEAAAEEDAVVELPPVCVVRTHVRVTVKEPRPPPSEGAGGDSKGTTPRNK